MNKGSVNKCLPKKIRETDGGMDGNRNSWRDCLFLTKIFSFKFILHFQTDLKQIWKRSETDLKQIWKRSETMLETLFETTLKMEAALFETTLRCLQRRRGWSSSDRSETTFKTTHRSNHFHRPPLNALCKSHVLFKVQNTVSKAP